MLVPVVRNVSCCSLVGPFDLASILVVCHHCFSDHHRSASNALIEVFLQMIPELQQVVATLTIDALRVHALTQSFATSWLLALGDDLCQRRLHSVSP